MAPQGFIGKGFGCVTNLNDQVLFISDTLSDNVVSDACVTFPKLFNFYYHGWIPPTVNLKAIARIDQNRKTKKNMPAAPTRLIK